MRNVVLGVWCCVVLILSSAGENAHAQVNGVFRQVYDITGSSLQSLTNENVNSSFPNFPTTSEIVTNAFELPTNWGEQFGDRCRALITAPMTGYYLFWHTADDAGEMYLSRDESAENKFRVTFNTNSALYRAWYTFPTQQSTNIFLEAGRRYYIETLRSAGHGDDSLCVGWKLPNGVLEQPIPASRLNPFGLTAVGPPQILTHPPQLAVNENETAQFYVGLSNLDPVGYEWQRNGVTIPGVRGASHAFQATTNDHGAEFRCIITNGFGAVTSSVGILVVYRDTNAPVLVRAANVSSNLVQVVYSEPVNAADATNRFNYSINNGANITAAAFAQVSATDPNPSTYVVNLTTSPLQAGSNYTITVNNVRDRSAAQHLIAANSQASFTVLLKGVYREIFTGVIGSYLPDLTNHAAYPNNPSIVALAVPLTTPAFEFLRLGSNNYGQRLRGRLLPPVSGNYTFWIAADDTAVLYLGTNDNPASARQIALVTGSPGVSARQWEVQSSQKSSPVPLVAGQQYYLEVVMKDAISFQFPPDHLALRWQLPDGSIEEPLSLTCLTPHGMTAPGIVTQPFNRFVIEGTNTSFRVVTSNRDPVTYQWQRNGTNIPGATSATYEIATVQLSDHGATYRCVLSNPIGSTNSASASLNVAPDTGRPTLVGALNSASNRVVVTFSERIEPATATNVANYAISGFTISSVAMREDDRSVTVTATTPFTFGSAYTIVVNNVRDRANTPNTIFPNSQRIFVASEFFPQDIPVPGPDSAATGNSTVVVPGGINVLARGNDLTGANDQFSFNYQVRRGDFDVKVRVQRLDHADPWTSAGLMVREDLTPGSRYVAILSSPSVVGTFFQTRLTANAPAERSGAFPANHPFTWLRLKREGGTDIIGYASFDGRNWTRVGSVNFPAGLNLFLGLAVSSFNESQSVTVQFRDFGDATGEPETALITDREPPGPSSRRTGLVISEIMYHPPERSDGRSLEFIELFNSNPFPQDISGYRISGGVDFVFPPGTVLQGGAYLVVARNPADIIAVHGIANVTGPYENSLPNDNGTVRLRNQLDAILIEIEYDSRAPWPVAADGAGHSIVLVRPSFGETTVKAWDQSYLVGGSPGRVDGFAREAVDNVVINEYFAGSVLPDVDYIELYNHSTVAVDLSGCSLTDNPDELTKFLFPAGTIIGPTGYVHFTETTLGFALGASGESIFLVNSNRNHVIDAIRFEAQETNVSSGRFPDGSAAIHRLAAKTPGARNAAARNDAIVINEIMYNPISGLDDDEFIELYNRSASPVNISGWRITDGIDFTFPTNTTIGASNYIVVAKNATRLRSRYSGLTTANTLGNYSGSLRNSGERIAVSMPHYSVTTNALGVVETNVNYIDIDDVAYGTGGRWGKWSDGDGSSLELIDPRADNQLYSNWADSDDTAKSVYTTLSVSGALDHPDDSSNDWDSVQIILLDKGECMVDNVDVRINGSGNICTNGTFGSGASAWKFQGSHRKSRVVSSELHVVATDRGDTGANRIYTVLSTPYTNGTGTISVRVKWLHGRPEILVRLRGNHLELAGTMTVPTNLGTPAARNSRFVNNAPPAITDIIHSPVLPAANQSVLVTARIRDPDGLSSAQLTYRVDGVTGSFNTPMVDNGTAGDAVPGDGIYSATIPAQPANTMVAFYLQAADTSSASARFPVEAPVRECLVNFGEPQPTTTYATYRFWITQTNLHDWEVNEQLSNYDYDGVVVYGNFRVIYNAGSHYAGSPAHSKLFTSPLGTNADYQLVFPKDDTLLNADAVRLQQPGAFGGDLSCQIEQVSYWMADRLGLPSLNRRSVNVFYNGSRRGLVYDDTQRPNGDFDDQWFPNADWADLYRIGYWYEFSNDTTHHNNMPPSLTHFLTTGGVKKKARYRQNFAKRAIQQSAHDFDALFHLVDVLNTSSEGEAYKGEVFPEVDVNEWARTFAIERILNNTDLYGALRIRGDAIKPGAQNAFIFKASTEPWKFVIWDIDIAFGGQPTDPLFNFTDAPMIKMFSHPEVLRLYWQALEDAVNGPLDPAKAFPVIDARYAAFRANGVNVLEPFKMKNFIPVRRDYIQWLLWNARADLQITSNGGNSFTNPTTLLTLTGTAPFSARKITINGVPYPLSWTTVTNWTTQVALTSRTNTLVVESFDADGNPNGSTSITVYHPYPVATPEEALAINEIMYNPAVSNASYVEIYNRSTNTTFALFNYRLDGVDYNFTSNAFIAPEEYLVLARDRAAFQSAYGAGIPVADEFLNGNLDRDGETLALVKRALTTNETDVIIDKVKFRGDPPWPARPRATNSGVALQLIDSAQDGARVSNWDDGSGWRYFEQTGVPGGTRLFLWLSGAGNIYIDDIKLVAGTQAGVGSNYIRNGDFEAPLSGTWSSQGSAGASASTSTNTFARSGSRCLNLVFTSAGSSSANLYQDITSINSAATYTVSFWYRPTTATMTLTVRVGSSAFSPAIPVRAVVATPGALNYMVGALPPYPMLWINEVHPGAAQPWVELYNNGPTNISLDGYFLTKSVTLQHSNTASLYWLFPTGAVARTGEFRVVFLDGQPELSSGNVLHSSIRLDATNGSIVLARRLAPDGDQQILDYITYTNLRPTLSFGSWPDGQLFDRQAFYVTTPGAPNNPSPLPVAINEWMASNTNTLINPARNRYDDWFELYNFGDEVVNLSGYYLTDDLNNKTMWRIPNGVTIAPQQFLLCWADNDPTGTNMIGNALHTSFQLSRSSDELGLYSPEGLLVDGVRFGFQDSDVSQGRFPDGNVAGVLYYMPTPTPMTNNVITNNLFAPVLTAIGDVTANEGDTVTLTAEATDLDVPVQVLTFSLAGGAPDGAFIDAQTGAFSWTPSETHGPGVHSITVVVNDNGGPPMTDSRTFTVTVNEVNLAPAIGEITNRFVNPNATLQVSIPGADPDLPEQALAYALVEGPSGTTVSTPGVFSWTPTLAQASTTNLIRVSVSDDGSPSLSATQSFNVIVNQANVCMGIKGDVVPRSSGGNNAMTVGDWTQIGRFVARLDNYNNACESNKVDCAPVPCGDGTNGVADWVRAGRYAAQLDRWVYFSNPPSPGYESNCVTCIAPCSFNWGTNLSASASMASAPLRLIDSSEVPPARTLTVSNALIVAGGTNCIQVVMQSQGNEAGVGFSLSFEPDVLSLTLARRRVAGALINTNQAINGRIGFALAFSSPEEIFPPGEVVLAEFCFRAAENHQGTTAITFGDEPITREFVDFDVNNLDVEYHNGDVLVLGPQYIGIDQIQLLESGAIHLNLTAGPRVMELQVSTNLLDWEPVATVTNSTGMIDYTDLVPADSGQRFYRAMMRDLAP